MLQVSSLGKLSRSKSARIEKLECQNFALADRVVSLSRNARSVNSQCSTITAKLDAVQQEKNSLEESKAVLEHKAVHLAKKNDQLELKLKTPDMVSKRKQKYREQVIRKLDGEIDCKRKERFKIRYVT